MSKKTQNHVRLTEKGFENLIHHICTAIELIESFEKMQIDPNHPSIGAFKAITAILDSASNTLHAERIGGDHE